MDAKVGRLTLAIETSVSSVVPHLISIVIMDRIKAYIYIHHFAEEEMKAQILKVTYQPRSHSWR